MKSFNRKNDTAFKEDDIRPQQFKDEELKVIARDIEWLLRFKNKFVRIECPACGSRSCRDFFEKNGFNYVICADCRTWYVSPRATPQVLEEFYLHSQNYKYQKENTYRVSEPARLNKIFKPRVSRLMEFCGKYVIKRNTLLEVGAGFGTFCKEVQRQGLFKRVIALELTPDLADECRSRGLEVIQEPVEKIRFAPGEIDVVASFEVIEHLFSPKDFVLNCASILSPGGLLLLTCPNGEGFDISVLKGISDNVDHEHINYFNPTSLSDMVSKCGFKVLEVLTPGELDAELVRNKILSGDYDVSGQPFLKQVLLDKWEDLGGVFQGFLKESNLSSHMWLLARRQGR